MPKTRFQSFDETADPAAAAPRMAALRAELARRGPVQASKFSIDRYRERVAKVYAALR